MQGSWTTQAQEVLDAAKDAAITLGHTYTGTEHLLLGLLKEKETVAGKVLAEAGAEEEKLLELIGKLVTPGVDANPHYFDPFSLDDEENDEDEEGGDVEIATAASQEEEKVPITPRLRVVLRNAQADAVARLEKNAGTGHLLLALLRDKDSMGARLLHTMGVQIQKLYGAVLIAMGFDSAQAARELSGNRGGEASATPTLDAYSRDLTQLAREGQLDPILGREKEIVRLVQTLCRRTKNNPCLVGEPGVGKTAIVEGLAQRMVQGLLPEAMKAKRVVVLDMASMVAGTKYRGEFEERIQTVMDELIGNPGILLFIDELHTIIGAGGAEGSLDAANILKPALSRGEIQIVGATTLEEYRKYIEKDAALERRFQPLVVEEPTKEETVAILRGLRPHYEKHHGVVISEEALDAAVEYSARYIHDRNLPDKAIDVMDEACSKVQLNMFQPGEGLYALLEERRTLEQRLEDAISDGDMEKARLVRGEQEALEARLSAMKEAGIGDGAMKVVDAEAVARVVSDLTKVPVSTMTEGEQARLARLEEELHKRVIGQDEAVKAVASAVKRGRVGLKDPKRPIGSFLFLGPTGVGKTELSKALAEAVFGSEDSMIRVDMSEYMEKFSVSRLIGAPPGYVGYEEAGQLSEKVRRNPYCVVLFDEIEKAHPDVFNILLQVLDDGRITDAHGRKVDFSQTIIIMTSNAGANAIVEPKHLGFATNQSAQADYEYMKAGVMEEVKRIFRPEFINRIDEIMVFHMLSSEEIRKIVDLLLKELIQRCKEQMRITLVVEDPVRDEIAKVGYDPKFGARPLRRQIQSKVEDALATEMLSGQFQAGDTITVRLVDGAFTFTKG